jgi:Cdc6-like AAA superfamily ATPase
LNTGTWLIEEHQYKEWKLHPGSLLCIYGTAGSGKTILSSTIVEDVLSFSGLNMNLAAAYFYFKADDITKSTSEGMLRSLLKQLFDRGKRSSEAMMRMFEEKGQQTPVSQLLSTFVDITFEFGHVYIVLDALDECQDLDDLFDTIEEINKRAGTNIHILFTSRDTKDIKEFADGMESNTSSIKLSASVVKQDIRTYIRDRLRTDRALKRWRSHPKVQEQIEDSLIEKSDGM